MFLTTIEKLNANQEILDRYQDLLEHELALVKKLRKKLEPVTRVRIMGIPRTAKVADLMGLLRNNLMGMSLGESKALLDQIREGAKPVVILRVPMNHYTVKKHPLTEGFDIQVVAE